MPRCQLETSNYRVFAGRRGCLGGAPARVMFGDRCPDRRGGGADGRRRPCSSGQRDLVREPDQPAHVVDQIGKADLGGRAVDADGSDKQAHWSLLAGEDVFDRGPHR
jgi:hypothetical protein